MKFRHKPLEVEATQWFRKGDHPQESFLDVNPGDYIVLNENGICSVISSRDFHANFEPVPFHSGHTLSEF